MPFFLTVHTPADQAKQDGNNREDQEDMDKRAGAVYKKAKDPSDDEYDGEEV
jgi:hypothetical protein